MINIERPYQPYLEPFIPKFSFENLKLDPNIAPRDLGKQAADLLRTQARINFPANIKQIARLFKIAIVLNRDKPFGLGLEGLLHNLKSDNHQYYAAEIHSLKHNRYIPEERATLSHEVGHVLLMDSSLSLGYTDSEDFCEGFAKSLLLPDNILQTAINKIGPRNPLTVCRNLYGEYGFGKTIPPYFLVERMVDLGVIKDLIAIIPLGNFRKEIYRNKTWLYSAEKMARPTGQPSREQKYILDTLYRKFFAYNDENDTVPSGKTSTMQGFYTSEVDPEDSLTSIYATSLQMITLGNTSPEVGIVLFQKGPTVIKLKNQAHNLLDLTIRNNLLAI